MTTSEVMGVQELIDRIRFDGVAAAKQEADRILHEARAQAEAILSQANREAKELRDAAQAQSESEKQASLEAVRLAARNTVMDLKAKVAAVFENHVRRLVGTATADPQFVRELVLALAARASKEIIQDRQIEILLASPEGTEVAPSAAATEGTYFATNARARSEALLTSSGGVAVAEHPATDRLQENVLGISSEMLREGVTLVPDEVGRGGVRVRVVGTDLEIDLTEQAVTRLMLHHMLPRFWRVLQGVE